MGIDSKARAVPKEKKKTLTELALLSEKAKKYDPSATKEDVVNDLRSIAEQHPTKFISRNFYRVHGAYSEKTWNQYFGTMEEFRSEAGLQLSRPQRHLEKHIAKHASLDVYRDFVVEQVEPWVGKYERPENPDGFKKIIVGSDFHDIECDLFCLSVFIETCRKEQPDIIVLAGDIFDCYEFSHFDRDPRRINLKARFEFVSNNIFAPLRKACPNAQIDFIIGNHEQRIFKHLAHASPNMVALMDLHGITLAELLMLDDYKINLVSKMEFAAYMQSDIREELKKNYKVYFDTLVVNHTGDEDFGLCTIGGHYHNPKMTCKNLPKIGPLWQLQMGCMCKVDADYVQTKNNWQQSFAIVYIDTEAEKATVNHVLFSDSFVNVNGIYYKRNEA